MLQYVSDIRPISYIKSNTAEMIKQVGDTRSPIIVTQNGEAKAVIVDIDSYQNLLNLINVMKIISIGDSDIKRGKSISHDELKTNVQMEISRLA